MPHFAPCPQNAKPFFPKIRNPVLETSRARHCIPQKRENIFPENKKPRFWDIHRPILALFGAIFKHGLNCLFSIFHLFKAYMVSRIFVKMFRKIYLVTRVFAQKGNGVTDFGHFFLSISQNFFDFCATKNKK